MLVYYAHAICFYGTRTERQELATITNSMPFHVIINPGGLQNKVEGNPEAMRYFLRVIYFCHALAFSRLFGDVTAGVGLEVNYALSRHMPVYEIRGDHVARITQPVVAISREETLKRFERWRTTKL